MDQSVATITQDYVLLQIIKGFAEDGVGDRAAGRVQRQPPNVF